MKRQVTRIALHRETLRHLEDDALRGAAAATGATRCPQTYCGPSCYFTRCHTCLC
jgi:hypothetical protein